jgi:hypothetical protein
MWKKLILSCWILPTALFAQNQPYFSEDYHTIWLRSMLVYRTQAANYSFEGLFRQQENEFAPQGWAGHNKPLAAPLLRGVRFWALYNASKSWRMDVATSWFAIYPTIRKPTDVGKPYFHDFRLTCLPIYTYRKNRLELSNRAGGEILFITPKHFDSLTIRTRLRERPLLRYKVAERFSVSISDEFFVSVLSTGFRYDQHRPSGMLHFAPKTNIFLDGGAFINYRPNDPIHGVTWLIYYNQFF